MRWRIYIGLLTAIAVLVVLLRPDVPKFWPASSRTRITPAVNSGLNLAADPRFPWRLSNTALSASALAARETGLLLENAFLDTANPGRPAIPAAWRTDAPGSYIVQSPGQIDAAFRQAVSRAGAVIVSYIPNNALLVRADAGQAAALRAHYTVLPYEPYYKVRASLLSSMAQGRSEAVPLNVLLFPGLALAVESLPAGTEVLSRETSPLGQILKVRAPLSVLPQLARLPQVQLLEPARSRVPANDRSRAFTGAAVNSVVETNYLGLTGAGVLVNVNDTGVDALHPDLVGRITADQPLSGTDTNGHGTHVAGIIAGNGAQSLSVTQPPGSLLPAVPGQFRGKAPAANLFSIALQGTNGSPHSDTYLQESAAQAQAPISNNSWHYAQDREYDLAAASFDAATRDALPEVSGYQSLVFVFGAGNTGDGSEDGTGGSAGRILSPATAKNVITVGALEQFRSITNQTITCDPAGDCVTNQPWLGLTDSSNQVASFSSRGNVGIGIEGDSGRFKPDLVAPGTMLISARSSQWVPPQPQPGDTSNYSQVWSNLNQALGPYYRFESGTSIAAASVSGLLALIDEFFLNRFGATASPALLRALLINGARPVPGPFPGLGITNSQGWGAVSLPASISSGLTNSAGTGLAAAIALDQSPERLLSTGQSRTWQIQVSAAARNQPLRVTLAWTDPPANPAAALKLVNDLDLIVTNLDTGSFYIGNCFDPATHFSLAQGSSFAGPRDFVNNVENVFVQAPVSQHYSVTVRARRVNVDAAGAPDSGVAQDFALVTSSGDGTIPDALTFTEDNIAPTVVSSVGFLTNFSGSMLEGGLLESQRAGAQSPLVTSTVVPLPGTTGALTVGESAQWRFYILPNTTSFTNAAFLTFLPQRLGMATWETRDASGNGLAEPDLDLYVSHDPALTNLDVSALANAYKSLGRGAAETIVLNDASPGAYYIGIKSESQSAAEFALLGAMSETPFWETNDAGAIVLQGVPLPNLIPAADPVGKVPGVAHFVGIAPGPGMVRRAIVTSAIQHAHPADLRLTLSHGPYSAVLLNHNAAVDVSSLVFDDSGEGSPAGARPSDGPGSLLDFGGQPMAGQWILTCESTNLPGTNQMLTITVEPQPELTSTYSVVLAPGTCREEFVQVTPAATNLTLTANVGQGGGQVQVQVFGNGQSASEALSRPLPVTYIIDVTSNPPIFPGIYTVRLCNSGTTEATIWLKADMQEDATRPRWIGAESFVSPTIPDAATLVSSLTLTNSGRVVAAEVGVRMNHPRASDLAFDLISAAGTRVRLVENRGGLSTDGFGADLLVTNVVPVLSDGGPEVATNWIDVGRPSGWVSIQYDFFNDFPDQMKVYYENQLLFDSGLVTGGGTTSFPFGPGTSTELKVVMNEGGNYNPDTYWFYQFTSAAAKPAFFTLTENPDLATLPVKFAQPPFNGPLTNAEAGATPDRIYCCPEESLDLLRGEPAAGEWRLEVRDCRVGPSPAAATLVGWDLHLATVPAEPLPLVLQNGVAVTNQLAPGQWQWFAVPVPDWAVRATNALVTATSPLDLFYNASAPVGATNGGTSLLFSGALAETITLFSNGAPPLQPGQVYYLGLRNTNTVSVPCVFQVDFGLPELVSGIGIDCAVQDSAIRYFAFDVSPNASAAAFAVRQVTGDVTLLASKGILPTLEMHDAISAYPGTNDEAILLYPNSSPALSAGRWYIGVLSAHGDPSAGSVSATEYTDPFPVITDLQDGVALPASNPGPAGGIDYYRFLVNPSAVRAQFELLNLTAPAALTLGKGLPLPTSETWDAFSDYPGTNDEFIILHNDSGPVPLTPGEWFLGAINLSGLPLQYSVKASQYQIAGTNIVVDPPTLGPDGFCMTWNALPGTRYYIEGTTNLSLPAWSPVSATIISPGYQAGGCVSVPSPFRFFRVREGVAPPPP